MLFSGLCRAGLWLFRGRGRAVAGLVAVVGLFGLWAVALVGPVAAAGASTPPRAATFTCDGHEQKYRIPAGTSALAITAVGAPGGLSAEGHGNGVLPADGADVSATIPVSALGAGTTILYVEVGCPGSAMNVPCSGLNLGGRAVPPTPCTGEGGFNGGGSSTQFGGGGGGASDVRLTSIATVADSALTSGNDSRLVVAGGGGGEGSCGFAGGAAGDTGATGAGAGGAGSNVGGGGVPCVGATVGGNGGSAGTSGGAGGPGAGGFPSGGNGSLGQGGKGDVADDPAFFGGAGGGGYYGGGAGGAGDAAGGGGGGGSSFWISGAISTSMSTDTTGTPEVVITPMH